MATFTGSDKAIAFLFDMVNNIADDYDSTATYALNEYAIYGGTLYKCTSAISTPEDFTPAHWMAVLIMDEVSAGGGGGGGTTVIANPPGAATDTLNKLQVASTIYSIPSGGGGGGNDEIFVGSQLLTRNLYTAYNSKSGIFAFRKNNLLGTVWPSTIDIPDGYKAMFRFSALLNTRENNNAEMYINSVLLFSAYTWIGPYSGNYGGHFGIVCWSDLIDLDLISGEARYIDGAGNDWLNIYLKSTTSQDAYAENITVHVYFKKI